MASRTYLRLLADRVGIVHSYVDATGVKRTTSDRTRVELLAAMGLDGSTEIAAKRSLKHFEDEARTFRAESGSAGPVCLHVREALERGRAAGLWTHLYSLHRSRDWGIGDVSDLIALARWAGACGAEFISINPLHALANRGEHISPYSPVSRLFRNPIYIDVEALPEFDKGSRADKRLSLTGLGNRSPRSKGPGSPNQRGDVPRVDYDEVWRNKLVVLRRLHRVFLRGWGRGDAERIRAYERFVRNQGQKLEEFAAFMVLGEYFASRRGKWTGFRDWPREYRDPRSAAVARFRREHREEIEFQGWLQFELDRQLGRAAKAARRARMSLGFGQDLAIGSAGDGFDVWAWPELFARDVVMGCPPDMHSQEGQWWGFPPLNLLALRRSGYQFWIDMLRANMRHAGLLRIDHALGLFRQFWIPKGRKALEGAYVTFPRDDLLDILGRESRRQRVVVVGEDLGVLTPEMRPTLRRRNVVSMRVLYMERDRRGRFKAAGAYAPYAMVMATTHDHATLAAHRSAYDIHLRARLGTYPNRRAAARALRERDEELKALRRRLVLSGFLRRDAVADDREWCRAVYEFLTETPSALLAISLDDLEGEQSPVNLPGVGPDRFPNWTRRMRRGVEEITRDEEVKALILRATAHRAGAHAHV